MMQGDNFIIIEQEENKEKSNNSDYQFEEKKKQTLPWKTGKKLLALFLVVVLSASAGYLGGVAAVTSRMGTETGAGQTPIKIETNGQMDTAEAVAAKVIPAVVGISTKTQVVSQNFFGMTSSGIREGVGTGFIVDPDGYILTNSHVISDGAAETIIVQLSDGRELSGKVLWNDTILDLAMVKIDASGLTAVELGDSDEVNIGAYAVAIGNPLGMAFERSVTQGVISGLDRTISVSENGQEMTMEGLMQTDASINSGNSGGPLLNSEGEVVGINSAKAASAEGLGFAIPINTAKPIIEEVMETGTFEKAFIGISGVNTERYLQYYPNDKLGTETGVYISEVYSGSPADLAGLKAGDVITAIEKEEIKTMEQLTRALFGYKPGEQIELTIYRQGKVLKKEVKLGVSGE